MQSSSSISNDSIELRKLLGIPKFWWQVFSEPYGHHLSSNLKIAGNILKTCFWARRCATVFWPTFRSYMWNIVECLKPCEKFSVGFCQWDGYTIAYVHEQFALGGNIMKTSWTVCTWCTWTVCTWGWHKYMIYLCRQRCMYFWKMRLARAISRTNYCVRRFSCCSNISSIFVGVLFLHAPCSSTLCLLTVCYKRACFEIYRYVMMHACVHLFDL